MGRMFKDSNPVQLNSICMGQSMKTVAKFSETEKSLSAQTIEPLPGRAALGVVAVEVVHIVILFERICGYA